jgi:hypothetical protein
LALSFEENCLLFSIVQRLILAIRVVSHS